VLPGSAPATLGRFVVSGSSVRFEPAPGAAVDLKGTRVTAPLALKDDGAPGADELVAGTVKMAVHVSGARRSLRVWDPEGPLARGFGFTWFRSSDRVTGRFIDTAPRAVRWPTPGDLDTFSTEGVEFLDGRTLRLRPFTRPALLLRLQGRLERRGSHQRCALPLRRSARRRHGRARLQPGLQPALRANPYTTCLIRCPRTGCR
jgi:hypothetical protein